MTKRLPAVRKLLISVAFFLLAILIAFAVSPSRADECKTSTECAQQGSSITKLIGDVNKSLEDLSKKLSSTSYDYRVISEELSKVESDLAVVQEQLDARKIELDAQVSYRNFLVRRLYKQSLTPSMDLILSDSDLSQSLKNFGYFQDSLQQIEEEISELSAEVASFEEEKKKVEELRNKLSAQKTQLSSEIGKINYLTSYYNNQKIVLDKDLNAAMQRQAMLAVQEKQAGNGKQSLGGTGSYAFYGYGTEHGVGMSQYGAKMLADQGRGGEDIIRFYYPGVSVGGRDTNGMRIKVSVSWYPYTLDLSFEDEYLAGIGEIYNTWPAGVKEAQIIAARSYAWPYATGYPNKVICSTAECQVYVGGTGKLDAVNATRGRVAINPANGGIARLYYHSTSGPHTDNIWDSPSFSCSQSSCPYLGRVYFNDTISPYNNWCGVAATWNPNSPPPFSCTGSNIGNPLTNADLEFILNASMLRYRKDGGHVEDVGFNTTPAQVETWLQQEGTIPIHGLQSIVLVRVGGSSERVRWVTATGSTRTIGEGVITGKRFRYIYNILSPQADFLWSTWFYVK